MNCSRIKLFFWIVSITVILIPGCRQKERSVTNEESDRIEKHMVDVNRILVKKDRQKIVSYIEQHQLKMQETGTGLWYKIEKTGVGKKAKKGDFATIHYSISLIDGTACYDSYKDEPKTFCIGQGGVESGLEEGILLLGSGGKAKFIMPPHLAYGLLGDEKKIPARAIIIYDVELVSLR